MLQNILIRDDREMTCVNKQVGQQGAQRKMNKVHYFMINPKLKEILSVAAELSTHKKGISNKKQRIGVIQCSTLILGSPKRDGPQYISRSNKIRSSEIRHPIL